MNGEDLCVDAHQEMQEIHMFDVYKVSESSPNAITKSCKMALIGTIMMMFIHIFIRYMYL